jgi:DNA polymerase III subunit gamma/tau
MERNTMADDAALSSSQPMPEAAGGRPRPAAEHSAKGGEYVVVARRYRPQSFADLVGQGTVSQALCNAIATDRVGHAYLFTGARGVGKTSTARILAKSLNCIHGPTATPCGQCDICQQIASGDDVDVLEIDGASNRGIDEIRQLRSNVGIRPSRSRFKVYIIDEVHMLTKEAFNALLKTLEEPPEHVKFIFCTTEPGKIPVTVLSRCQRFDFAPVMTSEIVTRLQYIVQQEGAEADLEALELLARRAAGSMRDSQSLLEQLLSFVSERITVDHVHAMLGTARDQRLHTILQTLSAHDAAGALAQVDQALKEGVDAGQLAEQLVGCLRDMMAALVGCGGELLLHHSPSQRDALRDAAAGWGLETLLAAVQIVDQAIGRMRQSVHERILLELALVRVAQLENLDQLATLIQRVERGELSGLAPQVAVAPAARLSAAGEKKNSPLTAPPQKDDVETPAAPRQDGPADSPHAQAFNRSSDAPPLPEEPPQPAGEAQPDMAGEADDADSADNDDPLPADQVGRIWCAALDQLNDMTADYAAMADAVAISGPNRLVVRFRQVYNSSKSFCERPERRQTLEDVVSQVAGRRVRLNFELIHEDAPHEVPRAPVVSRQKQRQQVARHPLVERAVELFEAEVINVEVGKSDAARAGGSAE